MDTPVRSDLTHYLGQVISVTFHPGLLVLSYVISLVGTASTLIHRRTSRRGYYNNFLLLGAAVTMGGVAIWSMHYIGNRATTMLNGEPGVQISYSAGVTIASLFVPISVLVVAFFVVTGMSNSSTRVVWWRIFASGTLSGGAISGMHYLGNGSIKNYHCSYDPGFVAGPVIIAAVASTVALSLFFVFRSTWTNSWWKRTGCAMVLAGAVSGMHWCAVMGTKYTLVHSRNTTVIVTACLQWSFAACLIMAGLAVYSARVRKVYANRAQRITLAAAVFDEQGRVLVTPDGLLPSEVVTSSVLQKIISTLLDKMNQHLARLPHTNRNVRTGIDLVDDEGHIIDNYDTIFCELFCLGASALAHQMNEELTDIGHLWDEMVATGRNSAAGSNSQSSTPTPAVSRCSSSSLKDNLDNMAERGAAQAKRTGHGHLMFLVRRVDSSQADHLAASGYCFAEARQVAHIIRSRMHIRTSRLEDELGAMERYACGNMLHYGVHVGLFAVRTHVHQMGSDVLVRKEARNLLPSMEIPLERLEPAHIDFLYRMKGMTLGALYRQLERANELSLQDAKFATLLGNAIGNLKTSVEYSVFENAKLVCKPIQVPCTPPSDGARPAICSLIAFTTMIPIHIRVEAPAYEFISLHFFKTQQLIYNNSPHAAAFARAVHRNMSPILDSHMQKFFSIPGFLRELRSGAVKLISESREDGMMTPCDASVSSLLIMRGGGSELVSERKTSSEISEPAKPALRQQQQPIKSYFGSIMISQEVTVDVEKATAATTLTQKDATTKPSVTQKNQQGMQDIANSDDVRGKPHHGHAIELKEVSTILRTGRSRVEVRKERDKAVTTFVDELFVICVDSPRRL
ncbi:hypothetical protein C7999DRAFT_41207 [Corynascus novoguineensis]|uniref:MHYT domain-containing protein n=1 Tax=Corynascus novoguineensis TaxID=1126955 RepID=A0AAN7CT44_9PEZI|nr:hypothetical protein C7999DRAFT_41207 [Corynascus novoguineensis]